MMAYISLLLIHDLSHPIVTYKSRYRYEKKQIVMPAGTSDEDDE